MKGQQQQQQLQQQNTHSHSHHHQQQCNSKYTEVTSVMDVDTDDYCYYDEKVVNDNHHYNHDDDNDNYDTENNNSNKNKNSFNNGDNNNLLLLTTPPCTSTTTSTMTKKNNNNNKNNDENHHNSDSKKEWYNNSNNNNLLFFIFLMIIIVITFLICLGSIQWFDNSSNSNRYNNNNNDEKIMDTSLLTKLLNGYSSTSESISSSSAVTVVTTTSEEDVDTLLAPPELPGVAWLMSFGGSGTSYTLTNVETMTNTTTLSNYGADYHPCISYDTFTQYRQLQFEKQQQQQQNDMNGQQLELLQVQQQGPFVHHIEQSIPHDPNVFILSKTHCGGYCMVCPPSTYDYNHSVITLEKMCRTGTKTRPNGDIVSTTYTTTTTSTSTSSSSSSSSSSNTKNVPLRRVIHLIRNPFDNIVSRMHLGMKLRTKRQQQSHRHNRHRRRRQQEQQTATEEKDEEEMMNEKNHRHDDDNNNNNEATSDSNRTILYTDDHNGLVDWCHDLEAVSVDVEYPLEHYFSIDILTKYFSSSHNITTTTQNQNQQQQQQNQYDVLCPSEWYRYIQWHNLAYQVHTKYDHNEQQQEQPKHEEKQTILPVHFLFYENYTINYDATVYEIYDFLNYSYVPKSSNNTGTSSLLLKNDSLMQSNDHDNHNNMIVKYPPYPFESGKSYRDEYYTKEQILGAKQMVQELSIPPVWELLRHYFL